MTDLEETIVGVCDKMEIKGDWTTFHINTGSQYPTRLSTKLPALVDQVKAFGSQQGVWHYKSSQGNENPNKPGTYYTNRYFNKVEPLETAVLGNGTSDAIPVAAKQQKPVDWDRKDRLIVRQTIIKAIAPLLTLPADGDITDLATSLEDWVYRDLGETAPDPPTQKISPPARSEQEIERDSYDDSIPF